MIASTMKYFLGLLLIALVAAKPAVVYDQRQTGELNYREDLTDVVGVLLTPTAVSVPNEQKEQDIKYNEVDGPEDNLEQYSEGETTDGLSEPLPVESPKPDEPEIIQDDFPENLGSGLLLLGAQEQCGPDRYRDAEGVCQFIVEHPENR